MSAACYANNGSLYENTAGTYVPCNLTAVENGEHSACCNVGDLCMSNGLCMEPSVESRGWNHYWRNGCTDKTFKDPACPNVCRGREEANHYNAFIFNCLNPATEYCCAPDGTLDIGVSSRNTSCCKDEDLVFSDLAPMIVATAQAALPRLSTSTSESSASTSTSASVNLVSTTTTPTPSIALGSDTSDASPTASSEASAGLSTGARAGLGVGITLGVLAIIAVIAGVFFVRRRKARAYNEDSAMLHSDPKPPPYVTYESAGTVRAELEGRELPAEMYNAHPDK